jgi:branched-chain amino acid aminotransferase
MSFNLSIYPWVYTAKFTQGKSWEESYYEKPHKNPEEEKALGQEERNTLYASRNSFPELPLVNYTSQYGMGCFEGLKAFPQKDGSLKLFRPGQNGQRMANSMEGLHMPVYPKELFLKSVRTLIAKNQHMGFAPVYDSAWEKDNFIDGSAVYIRPFTYSEPAIGLGLSETPWVVTVCTPVSSYFQAGTAKAITTKKVRATPYGTGWIKCNANYVVPTLAKKEAEKAGYMEAIFLDSQEHKYIEEGSSCNIFFVMKNGHLVTPELGDTILPGITRASVIALAKEEGITVEERKITIDEAMEEGQEVFVTGTAAGVSFLDSITHNDKVRVYNDAKIGETTFHLQKTLKGIQYGYLADKLGWMEEARDFAQ